MKTIKNKIQSVSNIGLAIICICILSVQKTNAQNVGIGATSFTPASSAMLEVQSTNKGLLIPRVALTATNAAGPVTSPATSLLVYNTATAGTSPNNVTPGYYYWNGSAWTRMLSSSNEAWSLTGNAGTSSTTNFIGTTDAVDLVIKTGNTERARILSSGYVGIGLTAPTVKLQVDAGASATLSTGGYFMIGNATTYNMVFDRDDIMARVNGAASDLNLNYNGGNVIINGSNSTGNVGIGTASPSAKLQVVNPSNINGAYIHNTLASNTSNALKVEQDGTGIGIYCNASGNSTTGIFCSQGGVTPSLGSIASTLGGWNVNLGNGKGISAGGKDIGVEGAAHEDGSTSTDELGGAFYVNGVSSGVTAFACVGSVVDGTTYKILGLGTVSTIVNNVEGKPVIMAAPEAPEVLFQDFGTGQLVNGKVHVKLDPTLSKNIMVNEEHPIKIFIQLNDECNGVFVTNKNEKGFEVVELQNGKSNAKFSWMMTATRKNEVWGGVTSDYENFRFKPLNNSSAGSK